MFRILITTFALVTFFVFTGCDNTSSKHGVNHENKFEAVIDSVTYSCDNLKLIDSGYTIEATDGSITFHMGFLASAASPYIFNELGNIDWYFHVAYGDPDYQSYENGQTFTYTYKDGVLNGTGSGNISGTSGSGLGTVAFSVTFNIDISSLEE